MEPFQLVCPGCASRLKVRNRSAIGQRLACPKCREMILVKAPDGHDTGESSIGAASFDDMDLDALLENRPPVPKPTPKPSSKAQPNSASQQPKSRPRPAVTSQGGTAKASSANPAGKELQPGENWTNPATKKKQRAVLITMASIGTLLLLGALAMYVFTRPANTDRPADPNEVADADKSDDGSSEKKPDDPGDATELPNSNPDLAAVTPEVTNGPDAEDTAVLNQFDAEPIVPPIGVSDTPPEIASADPAATNAIPEGFGNEPEMGSDSETSATDPKIESPVPDDATSIKAVLAESGTSILQIQNAASVVRNDFAIGTPRYFFEKIRFEQADPTKRKDQILLEVKYDQQTLQTVLHELAAISGLSLSIDAPSISVAGKDSNPKVSVEIENESTGSVIRKVAQSVGLVAVETDHGYVVSSSQSDQFENDSISVALLIENATDGIALAEVVRKMVWPGTWQADAKDNEDPTAPVQKRGSCTFADGELKFNHAPMAIAEARRLIDGIKQAIGAQKGESNLLKPVPWFDSEAFAKPFTAVNFIRVPIGKFFRQISDDYDVQVFADWHSLAATGWTSDSMAPGRIEEPTIGDVVRETAHGLEAAIYVVDEKTVWLTSPVVANNIFLMKIYPMGGIVKGAMSAKRLEGLLTESLGAEIGQPGVAFSWLAKQKIMVVRAPQTLQRQVAAVLDELN